MGSAACSTATTRPVARHDDPALDPLVRFAAMLAAAHDVGEARLPEPTAFCLASVGADGQPSARMLLLKHADERGFVFHTNFHSRKGQELLANPKAAMCFHWQPLERQVRVEGVVEPVTAAEADAYFATRPRLRQLGAWASEQSAVIPPGESVDARVAALEAEYEGKPVPRPPHWSGFRLMPAMYEFWINGVGRLHVRHRYTRDGRGWHVDTLYP